MSLLDKAVEFETDEIDDCEEREDGEQNLEDEAQRMLDSWDKEKLLQELRDERDTMRRKTDDKTVVQYDGFTDFETLQKEMTPVEGNMVFLKVLEPNPDGKQINCSNTVFLDCIGYLEHQATPFDSSVYDGKPLKIDLIEGPIIPGLLQGLIQLREGERANILIKPQMAYGALGCMPLIPGDATLFYHVKIFKVCDESPLNTVLQYERSNFVQIPFEEKLSIIEEHKEAANKYLRDNQPREAIIRYKAAIKSLEELPEDFVEKNQDVSKLMATLLQNAAITYNKLEMFKSATKVAKRALFNDPTNIKAYYQLAKARLNLGDYSNAIRYVERASKIAPDNSSFNELLVQINTKNKDEREKRDEILKRMSKAVIH